jgi:hypothetical protein
MLKSEKLVLGVYAILIVGMIEVRRDGLFEVYKASGGVLSSSDFWETRDFLNEVKSSSEEGLSEKLRAVRSSDVCQYRFQSKLYGAKFSNLGLVIYAYLHRYELRMSNRNIEIISKTHTSSDREVFEESIRLVELYGNM